MKDDSKLVTVYIPNDEPEHLLVKSILEGAEIFYYSKNEEVQSLFGLGQIGSGYNLATGPIHIQVAERDLEEAREAIQHRLSHENISEKSIPDICPACNAVTKGLPECPSCGLVFVPDEEVSVKSGHPIPGTQQTVNRLVTQSILLSIFWLAGLGSVMGIYSGIKALILINESDEVIRGKVKAIVGVSFGILGLTGGLLLLWNWNF